MMQINGTPQTQFKETEIGMIPVDWSIRRLGDIATLNLGRTPSTKEDSYWDSSDHPWVAISDLNDTRVSVTAKAVSDKAFQKVFNSTYVPSGTLLMSFKLTIGRVGILDIPALHNEAIVSFLDLDQDVERDFLGFLLRFTDFDASIDTYLKGKTLNKGKLKIFPIPVPPLPEQQRIAAVLNAIQDEIAVQDDILHELREFKRSTMERLFTYGAGDTPAETKSSRFGDVPRHWDIVPLEDCAFVQTGTAKGRRFKERDVVITVPYLRVANVQDGYLDLDEIKYIEIKQSEINRYLLHAGDVLMTEGGDFDKLGRGFIWNGEIEPCIHQNHVFAIRVNHDLLIPEFLAYLGQSTYGKSYFLTVAHKTTNLASINTTKLKALPVLLAPKAEQVEIVNALQTIDEKIAVEEDRKSALDDFFRTMLQQLMTGQIRLLSDEGLLS